MLVDDLPRLDRVGLPRPDVPVALPEIPRRADDVRPAGAIDVRDDALREQIVFSKLTVASRLDARKIDLGKQLVAADRARRSIVIDDFELRCILIARITRELLGDRPTIRSWHEHAIRPGHVVQYIPDAKNRDAPAHQRPEPFLLLRILAHAWQGLWGNS